MKESIFFHTTETACAAGDLPGRYYIDPAAASAKIFFDINGLGDPKQMVYPGRMLFVPPANGFGESATMVLAPAVQQMNRTAFLGNNGQAPRIFNKDFGILRALDDPNSLAEIGGNIGEAFGGLNDYMTWRIKGVTDNLGKLGMAYADDLKAGGKLRSPKFLDTKRSIEASLDRQLIGFGRTSIAQNPHAQKMKTALGISSKSVLHAFKTSGHPTEITAITKAIERAKALSGQFERLGTIGKIVSIGSAGDEVYRGFEDGGVRGGAKALAHEGGSLAGGLGGGFVGGLAGTVAAEAALGLFIAFGVGTGGLGFALAGGLMLTGSIVGSKIGESAGEQIGDGLFDLGDKLLNGTASIFAKTRLN